MDHPRSRNYQLLLWERPITSTLHLFGEMQTPWMAAIVLRRDAISNHRNMIFPGLKDLCLTSGWIDVWHTLIYTEFRSSSG
jgi:hypothetical protein